MHLITRMGLYAAWQHTLEQHADSIAIYNGAGTLRFADLQRLLDEQPALAPRQIHAPSASEGLIPFVIQTLRAWRDNTVFCPVESPTSIPKLPDAVAIPAHIVHLKFTSGSTGEPRCIMFRGDQLAADPANIQGTMGLDPRCPNLAVISLAHSYGFSNLVLPLLLQGHPLVAVADVLPTTLLRAVAPLCDSDSDIRFTLPAVPAMWRAWFRSGILEHLPLALAITAGAPMPLELEQAIHRELGLKVHNFLGSSECGAIAYDASPEPRTDPTLVGQTAQGVSLAIGKDGCLQVRSDAVAEGYLNASPEENTRLINTTFTTSDLAELRPGENVHLLGRASDAINLAGRKLDPAEVETLLLRHPSIQHCVVFGVPSRDAVRCEETVACVHADPTINRDELVRWIGDQIPHWKRPRHYWFTTDLKPNARGKTPRHLWKDIWLRQTSETSLSNNPVACKKT